jgi:hypothetical protein
MALWFDAFVAPFPPNTIGGASAAWRLRNTL